MFATFWQPVLKIWSSGRLLYQPGKTVENIRAFVKIIEDFENNGESRQVVSP